MVNLDVVEKEALGRVLKALYRDYKLARNVKNNGLSNEIDAIYNHINYIKKVVEKVEEKPQE